MAASTSTASVAGVHSIDHFALEVPRLSDATTFLSAFGLEVEDQETHLLMRAAGSDHIWGKIFEGAHKRLAYLALNCFEHDLDAIRAQAVSAGGREVKPPSRFSDGEGFWVEDPDGNLLQIKPGAKTSPSLKARPAITPAIPRLRGAMARSQAPTVRPQRLAHVVLFTPDIKRAIEFYERSVGLGLSDG